MSTVGCSIFAVWSRRLLLVWYTTQQTTTEHAVIDNTTKKVTPPITPPVIAKLFPVNKLVYLGQQFAGCSRVEPAVPGLKLFASCFS